MQTPLKKQLLKKHLNALGLLRSIYNLFTKLPDTRKFANEKAIPLANHLMSGLAVFGLKSPFLLDYDRKYHDSAVVKNLHDLYHVDTTLSDTYLRERLDEVNPKLLRPAFKKVFALAQRSKVLEEFAYLDGHGLISGDGTGKFHSNKISCPQCCIK